ncbi:hypothetical protein [Terribacillus sp. 7520-G]|uniref:hypothetical protein n=1 Tax=Terribacillus sp. 7520-G TaxID=2025389 RepID=UPI000BA6C011|nr:hypothetical protein [Terribacillus sp. 7520-G]PAD39825.1 hypothetical protein CHH53_04075 [Terribacillus sp. 7520-G]
MVESKMAYFIDPETLEHTYDQVLIQPDEEGNHILPENATWKRPIKEDGSFFVLAKWNPEAEEWEEGGTPPKPSIPEPTETELLGEALVEEKLRRIRTEQQVSDLGTQLVEEELAGIAKEEQLQAQAQALQDLGEQVVDMRLQQILNEGGTQS